MSSALTHARQHDGPSAWTKRLGVNCEGEAPTGTLDLLHSQQASEVTKYERKKFMCYPIHFISYQNMLENFIV